MYRGLRAAHTAGESNNVTDQGRNLLFTTATKKITHRNIYIYISLPKWQDLHEESFKTLLRNTKDFSIWKGTIPL